MFLSVFKIHAAETIAISYFDNTSRVITYDPLSKGISDMLITDLSKVQGVTIVERSRLEELLKEIEINKGKYFDQQTAQKLGKGLGAKSILTGAFLLLNDNLRVDARLVDVQSGKILMAESVNCGKDDFFTGYKQLVELISKQLKLNVSSASSFVPKDKRVGIEAVVQYSRAVDFADKGLNNDASTLLASTVKQYPDFGFAKNKLEEIRAFIREVDKQRELQLAKEIQSIPSLSDPQFGQHVSKVWTMLLGSWSYSKMLAYNNELRLRKVPDDFKLYGEATPITFGEMLLYYESFAWNSLKNHSRTIEYGKQFMEKYPNSMYYSGVKAFMEQAIQELEKREQGKAMIDTELMKAELVVYVDYFEGYRFRSALELMGQKEYEFFRDLYLKRVLGFGDDMLKQLLAENKFSLDDLLSFRLAAERFQDVATLDKVNAKVAVFGDESVRLQEMIVHSKEKMASRKGRHAEAEKKLASADPEEIERLVRNARELEEWNDPVLAEKAMRQYLRQTGANKKSEYRYDAWEHLVVSVLAQGRLNDAQAEWKNYQQDKILFQDDSLRFKRKLLQFKNEFNDKLKVAQDDKVSSLQALVYEKKADACQENSQYAEEAVTRMELISNYKLAPDMDEMQRYKLAIAYYNTGSFDESRKVAAQLKQKYPKGSFTQAIESLVKYMPQ